MDDLTRSVWRKACCENLYVLGTQVLGYKDAQPQPHLDMCRFIEGPSKKKLLVGARGFYKTSFATVARTIQILLQNPEARILIVQNTEENAKLRLAEIKGHFDGNHLLRQIMGKQIPTGCTRGRPWSNEALQLNRAGIYPEPSIMAAGVGTQMPSRHFSHICGDDIVAARPCDYKSGGLIVIPQEECDKAIGFIKMIRGFYINTDDPAQETEVLFCLNRWAVYDPAAYIINENLQSPEHSDGYDYFEMAVKDSNGELTWSGVWGEGKIEAARREMGEFMFWTQMMCRPYNPADRGFPTANHVFWEGEFPASYQNMRLYPLMDLADSSKPDSCFTTMVVIGVDSDNHIWILEAERKRIDTIGKLELINRTWQKYHFNTLYMEKNLHDSTMQHCLRRDRQETGIDYSVRSLLPKNRNKHARILRLQPHHESRAIHLKREHKELLEEMRDYPRGLYIDLLDTLGYSMDLINAWGIRRPRTAAEIQRDRTRITLTEIVDSIKNSRRQPVRTFMRQNQSVTRSA